MVKTKTQIKTQITEWVETKKEFTTQEVKEEFQPRAPNILLSPNRLVKYIKATGKADYDSKGKWKVKTSVFKGLNNANQGETKI
jgi:hypothetical protein